MPGRPGRRRTATTTSAAPFIPAHPTLAACRDAVSRCQGCELYRHATQGVFGEGPSHARLMLVGEQPGNDEDLAGRPFVGPAGKLLERCLELAQIDRRDAYRTKRVRHFKWVPKGRVRLHETPNPTEIGACLPWLDAELELIRPAVLVTLGATAAKALLGRDFRVTRERGKFLDSTLAPKVLATVHPSSILRSRTDAE